MSAFGGKADVEAKLLTQDEAWRVVGGIVITPKLVASLHRGNTTAQTRLWKKPPSPSRGGRAARWYIIYGWAL
jgi:hypothetical protein